MDRNIQELLSGKDEWHFSGTVYDLFSSLYTAASHDKALLEGQSLGRVAALLVSIESAPGGPYYSDFSAPAASASNRMVDKKTNEMIARFLALYGVKLASLGEFLRGGDSEKETKQRRKEKSKPAFTPSERAMIGKIRALLKSRLVPLGADFGKRARYAIERTIRGNPDRQMSLMPYYMKLALGKKAERVPDGTIAAMGLHNIFFWTAFIIYDDFWDEDEAADPELLPVANFFARSYVDFFSSAHGGGSDWNSFFHRLMDGLDAANAWETACCRARVTGTVFFIPDSLPSYGGYIKKYRPASGHILGPLLLLAGVGYGPDSSEAKNLVGYFTHYLIAMQINDDMHDWEEDIRRGHLSTAVDMLLRDLADSGFREKTIDLEKEMEQLRRMFWFTTLPKLAQRALSHTKKSRAALRAMKSIQNPDPLLYFINYNEKIAQKAVNEHRQSVQFLDAYGKFHIS